MEKTDCGLIDSLRTGAVREYIVAGHSDGLGAVNDSVWFKNQIDERDRDHRGPFPDPGPKLWNCDMSFSK